MISSGGSRQSSEADGDIYYDQAERRAKIELLSYFIIHAWNEQIHIVDKEVVNVKMKP